MKIAKSILPILTVLASLSLIGCDDKHGVSISIGHIGDDSNTEVYKQRIQQDNDRINPTGNQAICLSVGDISKDSYPYTINDIVDEKILNLKLSLYAKAGLFTEEQVDEQNGKLIYRYELTPKGREYAAWWKGSGNEKNYFCFGRVVVDEIGKTTDIGVNGKRITFSFHYEHIPDWIKNKDIYQLYPTLDLASVITERKMEGVHEYYIDKDRSNNVDNPSRLGRLNNSSCGRYLL